MSSRGWASSIKLTSSSVSSRLLDQIDTHPYNLPFPVDYVIIQDCYAYRLLDEDDADSTILQRLMDACQTINVTPLFVNDPSRSFHSSVKANFGWLKQQLPLLYGVVFICRQFGDVFRIVQILKALQYCLIVGIRDMGYIEVNGSKIVTVQLDAESG